MRCEVKKKLYMQSIILVLFLGLTCFTTYAYFSNEIKLENLFQTATVKISVNDHQTKLFDEAELVPGDKRVKPVKIKNLGTVDVYYKFYIDELSDEYEDFVIFNLYQDNRLIQSVRPDQFNQENPFVSEHILKVGETHTYLLEVEVNQDAENTSMGNTFSFKIVVVGVQVKNNPNRLFN